MLRQDRPSIALLSPSSPDGSGFAHDVAAICRALGAFVDLYVFTEQVSATSFPNVATIQPIDAFRRSARRFDRVLSIAPLPGADMRFWQLMLFHSAACIVLDDRSIDDFGDLAKAATPLITHSLLTADRVSSRFGRAPIHVPFPCWHTWEPIEFQPEARRAARRRLGFSDGDVSIVALGPIRDGKAPVECIEALEVVRRWGMPATLHFVGSRDPLQDRGEALAAHAASLGVREAVRFASGILSEQTYRDYLIASDLALNLRADGFGGVSATLLDCAAAGLPVVTNVSSYRAAGIPAVFTRAVPDHLSPVLIGEALLNLYESGSVADREVARQEFCVARSPAAYTRRLCDALQLLVPAREASVP